MGPRRAATIVVRKGDKFLMGKRRDNGRWSLPGGHVEQGESHHQGACRELMEETGIMSKKLKFLGGRIVEPVMGQSVHVNMYSHNMTEDTKPTNKLDPDKEFSEFKWFSSKEKLPEDIAGNLHHPNNVALQQIGVL
jgi:8-oxo-dGTP pyrophosphatase MutT (NUDIX family)